jgi:hypothetical protein
MNRRRVLAIGLDGFEVSLAERLLAAGELPRVGKPGAAQRARRAARLVRGQALLRAHVAEDPSSLWRNPSRRHAC